jgi:hypothetical protein
VWLAVPLQTGGACEIYSHPALPSGGDVACIGNMQRRMGKRAQTKFELTQGKVGGRVVPGVGGVLLVQRTAHEEAPPAGLHDTVERILEQ